MLEDSDDTLPHNWLIVAWFKVFLISILLILCLLASILRSSLATYLPKMSSASPLGRVSFKVSNSLFEMSEVSTDFLSFTSFDLVLLLGGVFWQVTCCYVLSYAYRDSLYITKVSSRTSSVWTSSSNGSPLLFISHSLLSSSGKFDLPFLS